MSEVEALAEKWRNHEDDRPPVMPRDLLAAVDEIAALRSALKARTTQQGEQPRPTEQPDIAAEVVMLRAERDSMRDRAMGAEHNEGMAALGSESGSG